MLRIADKARDDDSPPTHAVVSMLCLRALTAGRSPDGSELHSVGLDALHKAQVGRSEAWADTYYGVCLNAAEAYAARREGRPAFAEWRDAVTRASRIRAYLAWWPRLEQATDLLANGDRDNGRELLVTTWFDARQMGAMGLERRAAAQATRHRVPLPGHNETAGPLSRLTPREREVLDLLTRGATDRDIARSPGHQS